MTWAGPIEFSTGEIVVILLSLVAMALALPALGGVVAVVLYRRRTPPEERSRREGFVIFFRALALVLLAQVGVAFVIGLVSDLIG